MKKPVRLLLLGTGLLVAGLLLLLGLALQSGVQTWAARKALATQPDYKASVGKVSAGFQTLDLHDLHFERYGAVVTLPKVSAEFSAIDAGLNKKFNLRRLVAKGWTLDLTHYQGPVTPAVGVTSATSGASLGGAAGVAAPGSTPGPAVAPTATSNLPASVAMPATAVLQIFQGIFTQATLPFDLTLDAVELEGEVKLPPVAGVDSGSAHLVVTGGGLAAGKEGAFTVNLGLKFPGAEVRVTSLTVTGRFAAAMDTPRTFNRLATHAEAAAIGPQFPEGVKLSVDGAAIRTGIGENYTLSLFDGARVLAVFKADLPTATHHLTGAWKLDLRDADVSPFSLGRPLPTFALVGDGSFDFDLSTTDVRGTGKLDASAGRLGVIKPELAALGLVKVVAEFDLARRGDGLRVERLSATFGGAQPVAAVHALQPFEFNARTGELKVADPTRELLGLDLQALPLAWAKPWLKDISATGGDVKGEFVAIARNGGFSLRAKAPLLLPGLSVARAGQPVLKAVDAALTASADYTPQGWQLELLQLTLKQGATTVLALDLKAGQLAGKDQPVKAAGKFTADLPALLAQPVATAPLQLTAGQLSGDFVASIDGKKEIEAKLAFTDLAVDAKISTKKMPALFADVRADITAGGVLTLNLPLRIENGERKSDLTISGKIESGKTGTIIDGRVSSAFLVVDDLQLLGAVVVPASAGNTPARPPWAGMNGQVALALKKVLYSDTLQLSDVSGAVALENGTAKIVKLHSRTGDGAEAKLEGDLTFEPKNSAPYVFNAALEVTELDAQPLFKRSSPGQLATVEGKFSLTSQLSGRAATVGALAHTVGGDMQLVSRGGVFRGLPASFLPKVESPGKIAAGAAAIGNLLSSISWKKEESDIANRAQAAAELARTVAAIPYDQLNIVLARDSAQNTSLKDFALISPELRLTGNGQTAYKPGSSLLDQSLTLECKLRARGRTAEVLKYLGRLEAAPDDLGYTGCTVPLKVAGTLRQPDPKELNATLAQLALEKPGVIEKSSELINKLLGGK